MIEQATMAQLERYLDVVASRQRGVATNIANLDTPGYRTKDIDFASALRSAVEGGSLGSSLGNSLGMEPREVSGLVERPDGNNVSMERESMLLAETQLQFRAGVELMRRQFSRLRTAITEGKS